MAKPKPAVRMRNVALPVEHGGWSFVLEPIVLGLLVAPSVAGVGLACAGLGAFLVRHPFKLALGDRRRGKRYPRTALAERFILLYGLIAALGFALALLLGDPALLIPLLLALPFIAIMLRYDAASQSRSLLPELAGPVGLAAFAPAIALADGWALAPALALWVILAARAAPAILYVRARLRLERGEPAPATPSTISHVVGLLAVLALALLDLAPALAVGAMVVLLARAASGLSPYRRPAKARTIGILEIGYGAMTVFAVAIGHWFGL